MICCLNPDCSNPLNPNGKKLCRTCNTPLVPLLRNRFRIIQVLSDEGGFGRTYLAEDIDKLNERCVIKQLAPRVQGTWALNKAIELFEKEAQRLQELGAHPQIPTLLAYFEQDNYLYLVQQFIDGQNLFMELQQKKKYNPSEIKEILLDLLPVLKFIHEQGVIHRDIKPQNIIRRRTSFSSKTVVSGTSGNLVLIDFGSAKQLTAKAQMKVGTSIGSQGYSPIEQIRDGAAYPASDLFSLGVTCFHLLTGVSPFQLWTEYGYSWVNDWQQYLKSPMSREFTQILGKLLHKDIEHRYKSAHEVLADLFLTQQPQSKSTVLTAIKHIKKLSTTQLLTVSKSHLVLRNSLLAAGAIILFGTAEFWYQQFRHLEMRISASLSQSNSSAANREAIFNQHTQDPLGNFSLASTVRGYTSSILSIAISPDGNTIASNNNDTIKLLSLVTGQEIFTFSGHSNIVNFISFSPDGQILVSGSEDRTIKIWNLATGQQIRTLERHTKPIHALAFSHDGRILADASNDNTVKLWNLATGDEIRTLTGHSHWVRSVAFSPNNKILASGSFDKTIKLWNLATGQQIRTLEGHSGKVTSVAFSPDGKILASGSFDKTIKLWNLATGQQIRTLEGHSGKVTSVAFSPDGKILASGSFDKTVKLWSVVTGRQIRTLEGHSNGIQSVSFSSDGKTLVSGGDDRTMKIWQASL
ncbi:serine/threonine-protein kinase [Brasilonema sp. UFV-L1]|uniref:serine/threonine-protein kinase n=1 Tax=Brasilonema sp. UFV-L1 TaxID=2234130 RepID=UPI00145CA4EF|nr:serine/threonine-protein kinase [Brasilonema sp. UFV-L1]NMG10321.1 serine/threonine protein kinase [Brasilonema sp. UFV-L1]